MTVVRGQGRQVEDVDETLRELGVADAVEVEGQAEGVARPEGEADAIDVRHMEGGLPGPTAEDRRGAGSAPARSAPEGEVRPLPVDASHAPSSSRGLSQRKPAAKPQSVSSPCWVWKFTSGSEAEIGRVRRGPGQEAVGRGVDREVEVGDRHAEREPARPGGRRRRRRRRRCPRPCGCAERRDARRGSRNAERVAAAGHLEIGAEGGEVGLEVHQLVAVQGEGPVAVEDRRRRGRRGPSPGPRPRRREGPQCDPVSSSVGSQPGDPAAVGEHMGVVQCRASTRVSGAAMVVSPAGLV